MPKSLDFEHLRYCLDNYDAKHIFIRLVGSHGGTRKVNLDIEGKGLDFKKDSSGLVFMIDGQEIFHSPLNNLHDKGFSLAYERRSSDGHILFTDFPFDPYDPNLPEPKLSVLRAILDDHLMEITFKGRIDIEFHSWWIKPHIKYWKVRQK